MTPQEASQIAARKLFPTSEGYTNVDRQAAIILSVFAPLLSMQNPVDELMLKTIADDAKAAEAKKAEEMKAALVKDWTELVEACNQLGRRLEGRK